MGIETLSLISTILLAVFGYLFTRFNELTLTKRKERLEIINKQLNEFYGPLYVALRENEMAFKTFQVRVGKDVATPDDPPNEAEKAEFRFWTEQIFFPNNLLIESLIQRQAHLIREEEIPDCLLQFAAHVSYQKLIVQKWQRDDFSEHLSYVPFPTELNIYSYKSYQALKKEQVRLIGKL